MQKKQQPVITKEPKLVILERRLKNLQQPDTNREFYSNNTVQYTLQKIFPACYGIVQINIPACFYMQENLIVNS